jgi:hypothetical protein
MATGDQDDILTRLKALLPPTWFGDSHPFITAILTACAQALTWCYSLYVYAKLQTRINTATDGWLDLIAYDFFGNNYGRSAGQSDDVFRNGIKINLFRERGTRHSVQKILEDLTGNTPFIFEPQRPLDTGAYGAAVAVTRSSIGSYVDTQGIIRSAAANTVRYDANPYDTSLNGLMIEESSANQITQSQAFSLWTTLASSVNMGYPSPDGGNNAYKLNATATTAQHELSTGLASSTFTTGQYYVTTIYAKAAERSVLQIYWFGGTAGMSSNYANFDLSSGISQGTCYGVYMSRLANGWFRCIAVETINGAATSRSCALSLATNINDGRRPTNIGTGTDGLYIFGAQLEVGSQPSSYIQTVGSIASRDADNLLNNMTTNSTFSGGYGLTGGYGSQLIPYQAFITAYRPSGSGIPYVAGYSSTPSGYSIASRGEYASQSMLTGSVTDAQIYAAVASVKMEGTIAWVKIQ